MQPTRMFYLWLAFMLGNTALFTSALFIHSYTESIGHWSLNAWGVVASTSGFVKVIVWIVGLTCLLDNKFFKAKNYEGG